jgi:hypothetical protein
MISKGVARLKTLQASRFTGCSSLKPKRLTSSLIFSKRSRLSFWGKAPPKMNVENHKAIAQIY